MKTLRKVKDKNTRVLKSARKTHYLHEQHKPSKVALLAANLSGEDYDKMSWEETAMKISGLQRTKVKDRTQFLDIMPYIIWRVYMNALSVDKKKGQVSIDKTKKVQQELKRGVMHWLCVSPNKTIEGFDPAADFVGTHGWEKLVHDAIQAANEIRISAIKAQTDTMKHNPPTEPESRPYSEYKMVKPEATDKDGKQNPYQDDSPAGPTEVEGFASCWHEDGNFSLCHALHAQLTREGVDMGPSPYAPLRSRAEGSAGGVRSRVGFDGEMRSRSDLPPEPSSRSYLPTVSMARY
jgi:hypothetical protein